MINFKTGNMFKIRFSDFLLCVIAGNVLYLNQLKETHDGYAVEQESDHHPQKDSPHGNHDQVKRFLAQN